MPVERFDSAEPLHPQISVGSFCGLEISTGGRALSCKKCHQKGPPSIGIRSRPPTTPGSLEQDLLDEEPV
jgi:hypothetical protein